MSNQDQTQSQAQTDDRTALERPADPFKALGNETRLEIIRVLYDRMQDAGGGFGGAALPYSALREAVGIEDKGNFNYHLRQLDGQFVADEGDGYRLTFAGFEIAKVIDIDAWRSHEPRGPADLDGADLESELETDRESETETSGEGGHDESDHGDEPLTATYEDSVVTIARGETPLYAHAVRPAGAADREMDLEALLDVASTLWRHTIERVLEGICPYCHATVERSVEIDPDAHWTYAFSATCTECGALGGSHVGIAALTHPAVVSLFWEHGTDVTERRVWSLPFVDDRAVAVVDEDPLRLRVDVELEGDRLEVLLDADVQVVDTERADVDADPDPDD